MKKLILLFLISTLALPVLADTIVFTNGKKFVNCSFENNNRRAFCLGNKSWFEDDCQDKGLCISKVVPDNAWAKIQRGLFTSLDAVAGGTSMINSPLANNSYHSYMVMPMGNGSYLINGH